MSRSRSSWLWSVAIVVLAIGAGGIAWTLVGAWHEIDRAPLDPDLEEILASYQRPIVPEVDNGYFAYLGFGTTDPEGAAAVGARIAAWQRRNADAARAQRPAEPIESLRIPWVRWPHAANERLCALKLEGPCAAHLLADRPAVEAILVSQASLLDEVATLRQYPRFDPPTLPSVEWLPQSLLRGHSLVVARAVLAAVDGHADAAATDLAAEIAFWRRFLAQPRVSLVERMVAAACVADTATVASQLLRESRLGPAQAGVIADALPPMTDDERLIARTAAPQGALLATMILDLPDDRELAPRDTGFDLATDPRLMRLLFHRHWTASRMFLRLRATWQICDGESAARLATGLPDAPRRVEALLPAIGWQDRLFNRWSIRMLEQSETDDVNTALRLRALDGWVRVIALQARIVERQIADADVPEFLAQSGEAGLDPFTGRPMAWNPATASLDLHAPLEEMRRHLPVRLHPS